MKKDIIVTQNLKKIYLMGSVEVRALNGVSVNIREGEFVAIIGPSGSGKSTLLHLMGLLDDATEGSIYIDGREVAHFSEAEKAEYRLNRLGYVFQEYALLPELTAVENVAIVQMQQGMPKKQAENAAVEVLEHVGLGGRLNHYPSELSGGQQQRVAIARALAKKPKILFADEPTANLDSRAGKEILCLFTELNKKSGQTIIIVSHEPEHQKIVDRVIALNDGIVAKR